MMDSKHGDMEKDKVVDEILIDEFQKSGIEKVKIRFTRWQGREFLDVRVFISPPPGSQKAEKATHKGICLRLDLVPKLLESLSKAQKILEEGEGS